MTLLLGSVEICCTLGADLQHCLRLSFIFWSVVGAMFNAHQKNCISVE